MESTSLWESLRQASTRSDTGELRLWTWLKEKLDLAQYKPEPALGIVERQLRGREGLYYILKNPDSKTYYRLSDRDHFLWQLMDGTQTVKDLVVAYFLEFGSFAFARVATLVGGLRTTLLLRDRPLYVYRQVRRQLLRRRPSYRLNQMLGAFFERQFAITGLDRWLTSAYQWGGRILYARMLQIAYVLLSGVGLYCFFQVHREGKYGFVTIGGSTQLGLISLILANLAVLLSHEMGHALTVKHFGREVRRGGFMIYMGMPAFFVDTMDMWLEGKRARLAVTWAGPYANLVLGGLASIILAFWPGFLLNPFLYQFAFVAYLIVFFNLNPLLELDGYFLLMDGLEIPLLRKKSLAFVRAGLWHKLKQVRAGVQGIRGALASFSREETIFATFGVLSAAWTGYALYAAGSLWQARLLSSLRNLLTQGGDRGRTLVSLAVVAISLPFVFAIGLHVVRAAREVFHWAAKRGVFDNPWRVATMLLMVAIAVAAAPGDLRYRGLRPLLALMALTSWAYLAWRAAADSAGSRFVSVFRLLGLSALGLWLSEGATWALLTHLLSSDLASPLVIVSRHLAYVCLFAASLRLYAGTRIARLSLLEKGGLALGAAACFVLPVWLVRSNPIVLSSPGALLDLTGSLFPLLAVTLLVPTLRSYWRTRFGPAWWAMALAMTGLVYVALKGRSPLFSYSLMACGLSLHHLARRQTAFVEGRPEVNLGLSDPSRLQRAFVWTANSVFGQLREVSGQHRAQLVAEQLSDYARAAGWPLRISGDRVEGSLLADGAPFEAREQGLMEQGDAYAATLTLLVDLVSRELGERRTVRALQRAYDSLPWEERELAALYLYPKVRRAEVLSREFQATRQDFGGLLQRMPLFATMDQSEIQLLMSRLAEEHYRPGQVIIRQGNRGDTFYIIAHGHVEVIQRDERGVSEVVNQLDRGDYFGELALLGDAPRSATCRATVPTDVVVLNRLDFDRLVKVRFALREKVNRSIARTELLRRMPLFAELDGQQVQLIASKLVEETFEPDTVIIRQGEMGETFYVIESGRVRISTLQEGKEMVISERGPGEYVGEIALLRAIPRTATVQTLSRTNLLSLHKSDFEQLAASHLYVSRSLERETSRRMIDLQRAEEAA